MRRYHILGCAPTRGGFVIDPAYNKQGYAMESINATLDYILDLYHGKYPIFYYLLELKNKGQDNKR